MLRRKHLPAKKDHERKRGREEWKKMAVLYRESLDKAGISDFNTPLSLHGHAEA